MTLPDSIDRLRLRWETVLRPYQPSAARVEQTFQDLAARYREPGRFYHTLEHLEQVLLTVAALTGGAPADALVLAAWFHDAVYDTHAGDNEERSAALAEAVLPTLGVPDAVTRRAGELVRLTKTHQADAADRDAAVLLDADLAVLGTDPDRYRQYANAIRREYAWVADEAFREGRRRVLRSFLERPRIYRTERMFADHEAAARSNLRQELDALA